MTLAAGARLGPYEIQSAIGAGGMGEVYRARDTRLHRIVALKLLSPAFADRPDRRQRFHLEARAISSLQHPHICTLFDVGEQDGQAFLVMEYLEGQTLDDRLADGPLPAREVLAYAAQIAAALDHAHRAQIVHRDLKPSNVMLTQSGAKLLDFGLARGPTLAPPPTSSTASFAQNKLTSEGTLVGTFQYMAPEQLEGKSADERTDIFAFGTLLYEMATGRRAFEGTSQASLIASILTGHPPPVSSTRAERADGLPDTLDHVVERCLAKNPDDRWQTARDLKAEIDWLIGSGSRAGVQVAPGARARTRLREVVAWATAGVSALIAIIAIVAMVTGDRRPPAEVTRFGLQFPPSTTMNRIAGDSTYLAISPDGRHVAFAPNDGRGRRLWVQSLDSTAPRVLEGTDEAVSPFWSPDSRFIGYFARNEGQGQLKKVEISGGPPRTICAANLTGVPVWHRDGTILFSEGRKGLFRVSAEGGNPTQVTSVDTSAPAREINHYWPSILPDGRHFLYMTTRLNENGQRATPIVYVGSFDSAERREIARVNSRMVYAAPGRVLYVHEGALLAQQFDLDNFRLTGEPVQVVESIDYTRSTGAAAFSISENGVLAYHRSTEAFELVWFDRSGRELGPVGTPKLFGHLRLSRDGQRAAVEITDPRLGTADVWVYDLRRNIETRLTDDINGERLPIWSPDDALIAFVSDRGTGSDAAADFFAKRSDGTGEEKVFFVRTGPQFLEDWSPDGRLIVYRDETRDGTGDNLWIVPFAGDQKEWGFQRGRYQERTARFSPDGFSIAFVLNESGAFEVYIAPVPDQPNGATRKGTGARERISTGGGGWPVWRPDGKELFFLSADRRSVMAVPVTPGPAPRFGTPERLFSLERDRVFTGSPFNSSYDVTANGQRFLFIVATARQPVPQISVVVNWESLLR